MTIFVAFYNYKFAGLQILEDNFLQIIPKFGKTFLQSEKEFTILKSLKQKCWLDRVV